MRFLINRKTTEVAPHRPRWMHSFGAMFAESEGIALVRFLTLASH
jgi:hypothetical protein